MSTERAPRIEPVRSRDRAVRPDLRVVDAPRRTLRTSTGRLGIVLGAVVFGVLFALAGLQAILVNGQARIDKLDHEISVQQSRSKDLSIQVATMESPERVVEVARDRLGMVAPGASAYLVPDATDDSRARLDATGTASSDEESTTRADSR